jgi:hypothetical protein
VISHILKYTSSNLRCKLEFEGGYLSFFFLRSAGKVVGDVARVGRLVAINGGQRQ